MPDQRVINLSRKSNYSFIDVGTNEIAYCPRCATVGLKIKLGERLYEEGQPIPEDHDNWCQCHRCGEIIPLYEILSDTEYEPIINLPDNPFDSGSKFESTKKRNNKNRLNDYRDNEP